MIECQDEVTAQMRLKLMKSISSTLLNVIRSHVNQITA